MMAWIESGQVTPQKIHAGEGCIELYAISESTLNSYVSKKLSKIQMAVILDFRASEVAKLVK